MRCTQPPLCDRRVRIDGALEHNFLEIAGEHPQHDEEIGVRGRGRSEQFQRGWSCDLGLFGEWRRKKGQSVAHCRKFQLRGARRLFGRQRHR